MGMFDWMEPAKEIICPIDNEPIDGWQTKDRDPAMMDFFNEGHAVPFEDGWVEMHSGCNSDDHWCIAAAFVLGGVWVSTILVDVSQFGGDHSISMWNFGDPLGIRIGVPRHY